MPNYYEFFAGGGMARAGLGPGWNCLFANDIDPKKASAYKENWGETEISIRDVALLRSKDIPGTADLAWASFPCQDLSLAGSGAGLKGSRSGTFWPFWRVIKALSEEDRAPSTIVLENVCGALTSHKGEDFRSLCETVRGEGYRCGAMVIDAAQFLPQSRPRLFVIGVRNDIDIDESLISSAKSSQFHTPRLRTVYESLSQPTRANWIWWRLPIPALRRQRFAELIDEAPLGVSWHTREDTLRLLSMMSPVNLAKVEKAKRLNRPIIGSLYKRTRTDHTGVRAQRAEVRFDDVAGCLRTPNGGSSRQTIIFVHGNYVRSRLLSPREAARLMGLPDTYILPSKYNDAYHLAGDGVAVPVVRHLAEHILEPLTGTARAEVHTAA